MFQMARKTLTIVAACGALGLGGAAIAGAASNGTNTASGSSAQDPDHDGRGGGHVGPGGQRETALTGDAAAKVRDAALAKVSGGTIERVETDADHGSPYEAHVTKSDGTQVEVLVDKDFKVTAVNEMGR